MEKEEKVQYWLNIAEEDLDVAEDMHKTKHWLYVAFMCHQVMEKLLISKPTGQQLAKTFRLTFTAMSSCLMVADYWTK